MKIRIKIIAALIFLATAFAPGQSTQEAPAPLLFRTVIELALKNSATTGIATADLQRARATYAQSRDLFLPQMVLGSGLAYSYGFPLSLEGAAPSIFNVNIQEFLFNPAQRQNIKAAKSGIDQTTSQNADRRNDVIMEAAIDYVQLDVLQSSIIVQREQQQMAAKLQDIVSQRVQAGLDSQVDLKRAQLAAARTRLQLGQAQAAADQLRQRLSQLTGLPANSIVTSAESIPSVPVVSQDDDLATQFAEKNPAFKAAEQAAESRAVRANPERTQVYPAVDLGAHY